MVKKVVQGSSQERNKIENDFKPFSFFLFLHSYQPISMPLIKLIYVHTPCIKYKTCCLFLAAHHIIGGNY